MNLKLIGRLLGAALTLLPILALLVWLMWRALKRSEDDRLISKWIISAAVIAAIIFVVMPIANRGGYEGAFVGAPAAAVCGLILAILWGSNIGGWFAKPFGEMYDGGDVEIEATPVYSIAEAKRKRGEYIQALDEVQKQLLRFPHDVTGQLLLADIYAENFHDLSSAETVLEQFIGQEGHAPKNIAFALNRMADARLKLARDPERACDALNRIVELFPASEFAQMAAQRIAHMTSPEMLAEKITPRVIALEHHEERLGLEPALNQVVEIEDPTTAADNLVAHLAEHPHDYEAREKLAVLYAERFQRADLAVEQIQQLIDFPNQPQKKVVHWLHLLADLQIKYLGDVPAARAALEQIPQRYPKSAAAQMAQNRIPYLPLELKGQQQTQTVKLGHYEQNVGLKKGWLT